MLPTKIHNLGMIEGATVRYNRLSQEPERYSNLVLSNDATQEDVIEIPTTMRLHVRIKMPTPLEPSPNEDFDGNV